MHQRTVITLGIVLKDQLPIAVYLVFDRACRTQRLDLPTIEASGKSRQRPIEGLGIRREVDEDEALPHLERGFAQRIIAAIESFDVGHVASSEPSSPYVHAWYGH